jgi:hypothetical protein
MNRIKIKQIIYLIILLIKIKNNSIYYIENIKIIGIYILIFHLFMFIMHFINLLYKEDNNLLIKLNNKKMYMKMR